MRILFLTAEPPWPLDQGDKLRNHNLLRCLASKHRVTLVTFVPPGEGGQWREVVGRFCDRVYKVPLGRSRMVFNVLRLPHLPVTMAARASRTMEKLLKQVTQAEEYDLVFACQLKMAGFLGYCAVFKKVLELTDALGVYRSLIGQVSRGLPAKVFSWFERCKLAYWETKSANGADLVLLVSPTDAELLGRNVKSKIEVLPNGVDTGYFTVLPNSSEPVLLFYGHLRYPPNADGAIWFCREVLPLIQRAVPEAKILIAGKEPPPGVIELAGLPGVTLAGYVPDLRPCLGRASVVLAPLRFGAGIRNKILESLACGRPVVSTSLGCEGLAVLPGVHLEVADEPHDFAQKVIDLLLDGGRRAFLARNGRLLIESDYRWDVVGEKLNAAIENVCTLNRHGPTGYKPR